MSADIVAFDPGRIGDTATCEHPHGYPEGIDLVLVNDVVVVDGGLHREFCLAGLTGGGIRS
jgi:hypothetical protein